MKKIEIQEMKQIQIRILDYVDEFCKKNKINYWLNAGTLLGAVRHKGYIPWDDDIDIGMLRKDYDKFIDLFNKDNKSRYRFECWENTKGWQYPFGKILDTTTVLYEPNKKNGNKISVFIDLFPLDNIPDDANTINKIYKKINLYRKLNFLQHHKEFYNEKKKKFNFIIYTINKLMKIFPDGYFIKKIIELSKLYRNENTKNIGDFTAETLPFCSKDVFDSFVELQFEKKKYPVPVGYDKWLKILYDDYMKLPPKEKRVPAHKFEAYYLNEDIE